MDKITNSLLSDFVYKNELEKKDVPTQFEHFSNYCIATNLYRGSFEIDDIHTGGGGDCAIDGLFVLVNGNMVTDVADVDSVVDGVGYIDADIVFVQSKTSSSFNSGDIYSFVFGVKDFLSDESELTQNDHIRQMKEIWEDLLLRSSLMINRRPVCKLFYVCTGKWTNDRNLKTAIKSGHTELDSMGLFDSVLVEPVGASEIHDLYFKTKNKLSATVNLQKKITLPDIKGISEGYLGVLPFNEYLKLIQDDDNTIHSIFDDNVRDFLDDSPVNSQIRATLEEKKYDLFCVLNNGVTIVASKITPAGDRFTIRDYQVVNGCQTSHVLHSCQSLEGINQVFVPIKIVVTEDEDIKTDITLATNSQTSVKPEQLEALNTFQRKLEQYYRASLKDFPLYYERRSMQYNSDSSIKRIQIISIPIQIKSFASVFLESPHLVSGYYGTIVKRFKNKMFNTDHKYLPYYVSSLCYYRIEQFFRSGSLGVKYKKVRFHLMMLVRMLSIGENVDGFNSNKLNKKCEVFKKTLLNEEDSLKLFKNAVRLFNKSDVDKNKNRYKAESETELLKIAFREYGEDVQKDRVKKRYRNIKKIKKG